MLVSFDDSLCYGYLTFSQIVISSLPAGLAVGKYQKYSELLSFLAGISIFPAYDSPISKSTSGIAVPLTMNSIHWLERESDITRVLTRCIGILNNQCLQTPEIQRRTSVPLKLRNRSMYTKSIRWSTFIDPWIRSKRSDNKERPNRRKPYFYHSRESLLALMICPSTNGVNTGNEWYWNMNGWREV